VTAPARKDRHGVKRRRARADREPEPLGEYVVVKIARPFRVRVKGGEGWRVIDELPVFCTYTRESFVTRSDTTKPGRSLRMSAAAARRAAELVESVCWCEDRIVKVPRSVLDAGRRGSCGYACRPPTGDRPKRTRKD